MNMTIEHIDKDGRRWDIPFFESDDVEELLDNRKGEVHSAIFNALIELVDTGLDLVPSFSINEFVFEVDRETAAFNLYRCLTYFEESEQYEKCSDIMVLINKLDTQ